MKHTQSGKPREAPATTDKPIIIDFPPTIEATTRAVLLVDCDVASDAEHRAALQELIDSGMAWLLQGRIGREAMHAIEVGACVLGPESRRDYWGSVVPSRFEVQPGTLGSIEYARERGYDVAFADADVIEGSFKEVVQ